MAAVFQNMQTNVGRRMMNDVPADLYYTKTHEWLRKNDDGTIVLGITAHAAESLGDLVYVELPEIGGELSAGEPCAVVESTKSATDVYCPIDGIAEVVNDELTNSPELVNRDPYGEGWLVGIRPQNGTFPKDLLSASEYGQLIEEEK